jgi:hypothetical protein
MRFSSVFQPAVPGAESAGPDALRTPAEERAAAPQPAAQDLPDDLDARVRLVGEWQLGEA